MPATYGEIKAITANMPSGAATSTGVFLGGYRRLALYVPVITNAVLSFAAPTAAGGALSIFRNAAAQPVTASSLGGTGNFWLGNDVLGALAGYPGIIHISAAAAQTAARNFVWHLKG